MNIESFPVQQPDLDEIAAVDLQLLLEQPTRPDYSDPNSPDLDILLDEANGNIVIASRLLMDRMISGDIR